MLREMNEMQGGRDRK